MRLFFAAMLLMLGAPLAAQDVTIEELRQIADRFDRAQIEQDRATLEEMVADGFIFIGSEGIRQDRAGFIDGWTNPGFRFSPIEIADRYFLPLGPESGVVGGDVVLRGTAGSQPFASRIRFADTFRRINGRWQAVHVQATRVPGTPQ